MKYVTVLVLVLFATGAFGTWKLAKGYGDSTHSQAAADAIAKAASGDACDDLNGDRTGNPTVVRRWAEVISGYGGFILVYNAKAVTGCSY